MPFFVYILKCADDTLYVGSTNDIKKRLNEHNHSKNGAHYTKIRRPTELVYSENLENLNKARKREAEIKRWSREDKLLFIKTGKLKHMKKVEVNNKMQKGYVYECTEPIGKNFDSSFKPDLTPKEMLELGVFGGRYMRDCRSEYPKNWFTKAKLHPERAAGHNKELNFFKVDASQSLKIWRQKGWIYKYDPRGWFEWYARYYMGRRIPKEDERQIKRWKAMTRHIAQIKKNCRKGDVYCHPRQRQALLHWAYDSRKF